MRIDIKSPERADSLPPAPFDVFILSDQRDYECYIRSTEMLDQRIGLDCAFLSNPKRSFFNITSFSQDLADFIGSDSAEYREYQFIIDNTDFPQFKSPSQTRPDLFLDVAFTTTYRVSMEFTSLIYVGLGIAGVLLILLIVMICLYKKHKKLYSQAADRRMKRGLDSQSLIEGKQRRNSEGEQLDE